MLSTFTPYFLVAGRILIGAAFLFAALRNFKNFSLLEGAMRGVGAPFPRLVLFLGLLTLAVSSVFILTGYFLLWGGLGLALFLLIATVVFHPFWRFAGREKVEHVNAWVSNTALFGGALILAALGA